MREKIEKEISNNTLLIVGCSIILYAYFSYAGGSRTIINVALIGTFLIGLGGERVKEDTSMKHFIDEYELDIDIEKMKKSNKKGFIER